MARRRDINDIDEDEDGDKPIEILPEEKFQCRPALDTSQPLEFSVLRQDDEILGRSNQAFRGEAAVPAISLRCPLIG